MAPICQVEAAELMIGQNNFSSMFAKALLIATPEKYRAADLKKEVVTALKRFVFRYLRDDGCSIPANVPITSGYEELVSANESIITLLPKRLLVGHALDAFLRLTGEPQSQLGGRTQHGEDLNEEEQLNIQDVQGLSSLQFSPFDIL